MIDEHALRIAQLLEDAADHITAYGHWKGDMSNRNKPVAEAERCAMGALYWTLERQRSVHRDGVLQSEVQAAVTVLTRWLNVKSIPSWNDHWATPENDVIEAMRRCAKEVRELACSELN